MSRQTRLSRFRADARGNFAVTFALVSPLMIAGVGFGLDNWLALSEKSRLDGAADAAAIAAAKAGTDFMNAHANEYSAADLQQKALAAARTAGQGAFDVNAGPAAKSLNAPLDVRVIYANSQFTASVTYNGALSTAFSGMFGTTQIGLSKTATAVNGAPKFIDLVLVIDNSESMGIGSDEAQQKAMYAVTNCTVGCHLPNNDSLSALRAAGVIDATRIDVVRNSVVSQLQLLHDTTYPGQIRVTIYTFSVGIKQLVAPTTDLLAAIATVKGGGPNNPGLDLVNVGFDGGTYAEYSFGNLPNMLPRPGDGSSADSRAGSLLIFTDGVQDAAYFVDCCTTITGVYNGAVPPNYIVSSPLVSVWWDNFIQPFNPAVCEPLKSLGYTVYSLDFEYLITPFTIATDGSDRYQFLSNLKPVIQSNMAACASAPANAAVASTAAEFQAAMNKLMQNTTSKLRLTQ